MDVFSSLRAMPNKLLNKDGSITDFKGNIITPADPALAEVYARSKSIANKFLNSDDEIKTYAEISVEIFQVVDVLPEIGEKNKIYLIPSENGMFDEYFYNSNNKWDKIGEVSIDLSDYPNKHEVADAIAANSVADREYVDEQINNLNIHAFYDWDGEGSHINPENIKLWQDICDESATSNVIVTVSNPNTHSNNLSISDNDGICVIGPKTFDRTASSYHAIIFFTWNGWMQGEGGPRGYAVDLLHIRADVYLEEGKVVSVTKSTAHERSSPVVLPTDDNFADYVDFTPTKDMHPATKKYVDDTIKTNITDVLGGEY